jgi:hypothetical protein
MTRETSEFELRGSTLTLVLLFLLSLPLVTPRIYASDEVQFFSWLRSWTFDRDVDFENEYRHFQEGDAGRYPGFAETLLERVNEQGRRVNFAPIGCAILWAPFYLGGHLVALATGAPADGYSQPYVSAIAYASALFGFLAVLLSADLARRVIGRGTAAALAIWVGTPLVYYVYITPPFSHATSAFMVSLFVWTWIRVRHAWTPRRVALLAAIGAVMAMVREQDMFFLVGPAVDFAISLHRSWASVAAPERKKLLVGAVAMTAVAALAFLLVYAPQLLAYQALNGHPSQTQLVLRKLTWTSPHALEVLLSAENGFFAWTPLALVSIAGLVILATRRWPWPHPDARLIGLCALLMVLGQVYISGAVESWTVAGSFGQRRFVALTPLLTLGLATLVAVTSRARPARLILAGAVLIAIWWNVGLMAQFGLHRMSRQRLDLAENARQTFVVLPLELPGLAYRYLTDRASFYRLPRQ